MNTLPKLEGTKFYFHEVLGFHIIDKNYGLLGKCENILEYPQQALFQVFHNKKEILVPTNDSFIIEVNREKKEITVEMPEGLLDVYLSDDSKNDE
jgi:16S rRNA processing protein RimM